MKQKETIILAIETSCDDTCAAVLKIKDLRFKILSNIVSSQTKLHQKYGGVYPTLAKREHQRNLVPVLKQSLLKTRLLKLQIKNKKSKLQIKNKKLEKILIREKTLYGQLRDFFEKYQKPKINAIAVTIGPGLEPCLWTGVNFAKVLGYFWNLPIIPVNHIEAHILTNLIGKKLKTNLFPAVCLVVSGGHTQLILMRDIGKYKILGETRDDAAGECFDKTARILGLGYPGGPVIAAGAAKNWKIKSPKSLEGLTFQKLPRPMIHSKNYDFSFSGLKTAVLYFHKKQTTKIQKSEQYIQEMCAEIQQAIIDVLVSKTIRAAKEFKAKTIILGGGVASNNELRKQFNSKLKTLNYKLNFFVPPKNLCTDNAAMTGAAAFFHLKKKAKDIAKIKANANLRID